MMTHNSTNSFVLNQKALITPKKFSKTLLSWIPPPSPVFQDTQLKDDSPTKDSAHAIQKRLNQRINRKKERLIKTKRKKRGREKPQIPQKDWKSKRKI